ncbi:MAG TPA: hypothetical protein GYA07_06385 [Verrucomicrobia bacterium]|nr:hypothetical protein [Verrucomicrobiota bacterium]HOP95829.1 protein-disulfide reductase DsbD family protein [Verrucomicrobiota bacterium]HPU55532.1 protein-disulfide reductase DsbD family protein [Verrucomicrobiota bacterium]
MRSIVYSLVAAFLGCFGARAATTQASLLLSAETAAPGTTLLAGVHLKMAPHWHVYWKNAGASGIPTTIEWSLPPGVTAGDIQWPVPTKLPPEEYTTYVYEDEVLLLVPLTLDSNLNQPGPLDLKAKVAWLECMESCIPGSAEVTARLNIGPETKPSAHTALFEAWKAKLPAPMAKGWWEGPAKDNLRPLVIEWTALDAGNVDFFPYGSEQFEVQPATERLSAEPGKVRLRKQVKRYQGNWPSLISGVLVQQAGDRRIAQEVTLALADEKGVVAVSASTANTAAAPLAAEIAVERKPLWLMLIYAFVGGLILNVMPCVLPVIALKIVGFVNDAKHHPAQVRKLGFIYGLGVLVSFLALAVLVIAVQAAGHHAGWGMQFDSPYFLLIMTALVTLIALNLFGVFEINLGGRAMSAASSLSAKRGAAGAFFNGLLATALATSCTAPLLGAAVGFAFAQPPLIIVLFMLTIGLGLAFPYVVLSCQPAWLRLLPKPGPWMEKFKVAMGFPMLGAAIWLCSQLTTHYGERAWSLVMFLVILAVAAWIFGQFVQRGTRYKGTALASAVLLCAAGYAYALEHGLDWRRPISSEGEDVTGAVSSYLAPAGYDWQPWSPEAVAAARAEGRPVIVDFTARWCLTCNLDVKPVLASEAVREKLKSMDAVALLADYTRFPKHITAELKRFGRAGVPLVVVYPKDPTRPPIVLPEALTRGMVLSALDEASK